jgi:hypothetical protein
LISEHGRYDAVLSLAERIEINLAEALSRSSSIALFGQFQSDRLTRRLLILLI